MSLVTRLAELVAFDTQNPSGDERPLVAMLARQLSDLGAASVQARDVDGHAFVYARFGAGPARLLVNAHVDTVPANSGYQAPPHLLRERDGRLYGLGSADTKGAIAAIMEALADVRMAGGRADGVALLFSGDEESKGTCMRRFLNDPSLTSGLQRAIVCEPTGCRVGWRHRGIGAAAATARSEGGHSSRVDAISNPIAVLARAAVALDDFGRGRRGQGPADFPGVCLNVAALDGGVAFNVIPTEATLRLSLRPAPGTDVAALLSDIEAVARAAAAPEQLEWCVINCNPPFQTRDLGAYQNLLGEAAKRPVDLAFWTEAALLAAAGIDAVVFGPGRIEQAHAADEFVDRAELETAHAVFQRLFATSTSPAEVMPH